MLVSHHSANFSLHPFYEIPKQRCTDVFSLGVALGALRRHQYFCFSPFCESTNLPFSMFWHILLVRLMELFLKFLLISQLGFWCWNTCLSVFGGRKPRVSQCTWVAQTHFWAHFCFIEKPELSPVLLVCFHAMRKCDMWCRKYNMLLANARIGHI